MEIISISLDGETLAELDRIQARLGFGSRSKLMRATIGSLLNEYRVLEGLKGHCDAVFTVTYNQRKEDELRRLLLPFEEIVRTEIHQHHAGVHLRILVVCGEAEGIRDFFSALKTGSMVRSVSVSLL